MSMRNAFAGAGAGCGAVRQLVGAGAGTVKIGVILPIRVVRRHRQPARQRHQALHQQNGTPSPEEDRGHPQGRGRHAPDVAKRLAQELVVRDKVDISRLRAHTQRARRRDVSAEAKKFMVDMLAATSIITTKSPYMARVSFTTPQLNDTLGAWPTAAGCARSIRWWRISALDMSEAAFQQGFKAAGGEIVGSVRFRSPIRLLGLCAACQGRESAGHLHLDPGGAMPGAVGKALAQRASTPPRPRCSGRTC